MCIHFDLVVPGLMLCLYRPRLRLLILPSEMTMLGTLAWPWAVMTKVGIPVHCTTYCLKSLCVICFSGHNEHFRLSSHRQHRTWRFTEDGLHACSGAHVSKQRRWKTHSACRLPRFPCWRRRLGLLHSAEIHLPWPWQRQQGHVCMGLRMHKK
jgi:hypothetical protein